MAKSYFVRRAVTLTWRHPRNGWTQRKRLAVPSRRDASSYRAGCPGRAGKGCRVSLINGTGLSSKQTCGRRTSYGSAYTSSTSSLCQTQSGLTLGMHHSLRCHGLRAFFLAPGVRLHLRPPQPVGVRPDGQPALASSSVSALQAVCYKRALLKRLPVCHPTFVVYPVASVP